MLTRQVITVWRRLIMPHWSRTIALLLSVSLGIGSVLTIDCLIHSAQHGIRHQARDLLGADLVLSAWRPLNDSWSLKTRKELKTIGRLADVVELATMTQLDQEEKSIPKLTSLKGISHHYPLHGKLNISIVNRKGILSPPQSVTGKDLNKEGVWVAQTIWNRVQSTEPSTSQFSLSIAGKSFPILGVIENEPDGGFAGALSFAPRVMIHQETLHSLGLI